MFLTTVFFEIVVPLIIIVLPLALTAFLMNMGGGYIIAAAIFYLLLLPIITALVQRALAPTKKKVDLYALALLGLIAFSVAFWIHSIVIEIGFFLLFYLLTKRRSSRFSFIGLCLVASILLLLPAFIPARNDLIIFVTFFSLFIIAGLGSYTLIVGRERFLERPRILLVIAMIYLTSISAIIHGVGARTGWLTRAITKQKGVELLLPASPDTTGPRAVIPVKDGLLIYNNKDDIVVFHNNNNRFETFSPPIKMGRGNFPVCDLEDKSICYFSARKIGIAIVNTSNWQMDQVNFYPSTYELLAADKDRRYLAILDDTGTHLAIAKRVAAGKLENIGELVLDKPLLGEHITFVGFIGQTLSLIVRARNNVKGFAYDLQAKQAYKFVDAEIPIGKDICWHGATCEGGIVVLPMVSGRVFVLNINNRMLHRSYLFPFLRHVIYDPQRKLCYILSDIGFLYIYDPWHAKKIKRLFMGFKTKNVHHEWNYLYIGSTAGIFRIDIDRAIQ